jgi:phosphohistidine phosphatase
MLLYFLRHAEAEDSGPSGDFSRRLTEHGRQRSREAGEALAALGIHLDLILASPLVRAQQTAEAVAEVLGVEARPERILGGNFDLHGLAEIVAHNHTARDLLVVGHEPDFSYVTGQLAGGANVEMKKGAIACVETQGIARGSGTLEWLLTGRQMSLMGTG